MVEPVITETNNKQVDQSLCTTGHQPCANSLFLPSFRRQWNGVLKNVSKGICLKTLIMRLKSEADGVIREGWTHRRPGQTGYSRQSHRQELRSSYWSERHCFRVTWGRSLSTDHPLLPSDPPPLATPLMVFSLVCPQPVLLFTLNHCHHSGLVLVGS